jgi:hypothetical protein
MKKTLLISFLIISAVSSSFAQATDWNKVVTDYAKQVDLMVAKKDYDMLQMTNLAEKIWCSCTEAQLKQAGDSMHSNPAYRRDCESKELPKDKIISDAVFTKFLAQVNRLKKAAGM